MKYYLIDINVVVVDLDELFVNNMDLIVFEVVVDL